MQNIRQRSDRFDVECLHRDRHSLDSSKTMLTPYGERKCTAYEMNREERPGRFNYSLKFTFSPARIAPDCFTSVIPLSKDVSAKILIKEPSTPCN